MCYITSPSLDNKTFFKSQFTDITIGFEEMAYNTSEQDGMLEVCIKFFNPPHSEKTEHARYEIQLDYGSVNGTAS